MENLLIVVTEKEFPTSELFSGRFSNFDNFEKRVRMNYMQLASFQTSAQLQPLTMMKISKWTKIIFSFRVAKNGFVVEIDKKK